MRPKLLWTFTTHVIKFLPQILQMPALVFLSWTNSQLPIELGCHIDWTRLWRMLCSQSYSHLQWEKASGPLRWWRQEPLPETPVERKSSLLLGAQPASQTKLRCPTRTGGSPMKSALPASRSFLTKTPAWRPNSCLLRCWWDLSKSHTQIPMNCTFPHIRISLVYGLNCVPPPKKTWWNPNPQDLRTWPYLR